jgi:hypothetical protein
VRFTLLHGKDLKLWSVELQMYWGGGGGGTNWKHPYTAQRAGCNLLPSVITNVQILVFSTAVLSFINSYLMNWNEFLHADGGLTLHPGT